MHTSFRLLFILMMFFAAGCQDQGKYAVSTQSEDEIVATLKSRSAAFSAAYVRGDVETMMSIYTNDAVIFPGNSYEIAGDSLVRSYWTLPAGRTISHHQMITHDIRIEGSMATDYGVYEVSGSNNGTDWGPSRGKYVVVWRLEDDGEWRIYLDMWNSLPQG